MKLLYQKYNTIYKYIHICKYDYIYAKLYFNNPIFVFILQAQLRMTHNSFN